MKVQIFTYISRQVIQNAIFIILLPIRSRELAFNHVTHSGNRFEFGSTFLGEFLHATSNMPSQHPATSPKQLQHQHQAHLILQLTA